MKFCIMQTFPLYGISLSIVLFDKLILCTSFFVNEISVLSLVLSHSHCLVHTYRVYSYLCRAVRNFARDRGGVNVTKEFYVAFEDVPTRHK